MGFMTIDGQRVEFTNEPNVLTVIRNAEIDIPTLCYHSELVLILNLVEGMYRKYKT